MPHKKTVAVIGAGPAGLIAAERIAAAGHAVTVFDAMPSPARKFLMAGRGGLNLTHSDPLAAFLGAYRPQAPTLLEAVRAFPPKALIAWCEALGQPTFVGSSGRVFPKAMKASPLLRAWLARLGASGVTLAARHRWVGFAEGGALRFETPDGVREVTVDATVLALGGASWPRLGSDGAWAALLPGVRVNAFAPANMGLGIAWSELFRERHAGTPLKRIVASFGARSLKGEAMVTQEGLEGGVVYQLAAEIRDALATGPQTLRLDLRPDLTQGEVNRRMGDRPRAESLATQLRKALALAPVAIALVQEALHGAAAGTPPAGLVKALPLRVGSVQGLARAISSAGGIAWEAVDDHLMLRAHPGVFVAGEMLDWEAPTGGWLLQGCFATGVLAAEGVCARLS